MEEVSGTNTYCLFCRSGQERQVMQRLEGDGYTPLVPQVMKWKTGEAGLKKRACSLLPGYVFFDAEANVVPEWTSIRKYIGVLKVLQYDDGERIMRGSDAEFVEWLKKYNGTIEISNVIQIGTKLEFVSGPMRDMAGRVVKVNKNRKQVLIALGDEGSLMRNIWCSIEFIETSVDTAQISR